MAGILGSVRLGGQHWKEYSALSDYQLRYEGSINLSYGAQVGGDLFKYIGFEVNFAAFELLESKGVVTLDIVNGLRSVNE